MINDPVLVDPTSTDMPEAEIELVWDTDASFPPTTTGFLLEANVYRFPTNIENEKVLTQQVLYTYKDATLNAALGTDGDLVQVIKKVRVDPDPGLSAAVWRIFVTQYRYHNGSSAEDGFDADADGFAREFGKIHQLKCVILPEQFEFGLQQYNNNNAVITLDDYAALLLGKNDGELAFTGDDSTIYKVMDLAAKVIEEYETEATGRVLTQYLQSACGCGGSGGSGATQGKKLTYEYFENYDTNHVNNLDKITQTTKVVERKLVAGSSPPDYDYHRTLYYDLYEPDSGSGIPYLRLQAIHHDDDLSPDGIVDPGEPVWVTRYEHDAGDRNLIQVNTPSAMGTYSSGSAGTTNFPTYTPQTDAGYIHVYGYNSENRRIQSARQKGSSGSVEIVSQTDWGVTDIGAERLHLPREIRRFRDGTDTTTENEKEVVKFIYGFHQQFTGSDVDDDIAWVETEVEAEIDGVFFSVMGENGPGGSYYSHEFFDTSGLNYWSRAADNCLTKREFDLRTGLVTRTERNITPDSPFPSTTGTTSSSRIDFLGRNGEGGSLANSYSRDLLGRIQQHTSPSGVSTYTRREMRDFPGRTNLQYYAEISLPHEINSANASTDGYGGPAMVSWYNAGDDHIGANDYELQPTGYIFASNPQTTYTLVISDYDMNGDEVAETGQLTREEVVHDLSGLVIESKQWHSLDLIGENGGIYTSFYDYDGLGRLVRDENAVGTFTDYTYDVLDRLVTSSVGTALETPVMVQKNFYDYDHNPLTDLATLNTSGDQGIGNSNLTVSVDFVNSTAGSERITKYTYDFRDRLVSIENPLVPHELIVYDNLDRVIRRAVFKTTPPLDFTGSPMSVDTAEPDFENDAALPFRGKLYRKEYSQRGLLFADGVMINPLVEENDRTGLFNINGFMVTFFWFDEVGRPVQIWSPNSPGEKIDYDALGRRKVTYLTDRGGDALPTWAGAHASVYNLATHSSNVLSDAVIEETHYEYHEEALSTRLNLLRLTTTHSRSHDATGTGTLASLGTQAVTTYVGYFYDNANRLTDSANYGTNQAGFVSGGPTLTIGETTPAPSRSNDILVSSTAYNARGLADTTTDPEARVTRSEYDDLNRQKAVFENYQDGTVAWNAGLSPSRWDASGVGDSIDGDDDRTTSFVYDGIDHVTVQTAHLPTTDQVTEYLYGIPKGTNDFESEIATNDILFQTIYPDDGDGGSAVPADYINTYAYNRQGETVFLEDQNGTKHTYDRDHLGRVTRDEAIVPVGNPHQLDETLNKFVKAIETTYDGFSRMDTTTSKNQSEAVLNQVKFLYTQFWNVEFIFQDSNGVAEFDSSNNPLNDTARVEQRWVEKSWLNANYSRRGRLKYPDHQTIFHTYSSGINDKIARIDNIFFDNPQQRINYDYVGLGMFSGVDYAMPDIQLDRTATHDGMRRMDIYDTTAQGTYPGFDRFGRVVRQMWVDGAFDDDSGSTEHANIPPVVELTHTYDRVSNRSTSSNENPALAEWIDRDSSYAYDKLHRMENHQAGKLNNEFPKIYTLGHQWNLDLLGNRTSIDYDTNDDGTIDDVNGSQTHNDANEQLSFANINRQGGQSPGFIGNSYDSNGNKNSVTLPNGAPDDIKYTYDAWDRLVRFEQNYIGGRNETYVYNGLNWRIRRTLDPGTSGGTAQDRQLFYSFDWKLLEEFIDDNYDSQNPAVDRHMQYIWGPRYADDIICRRVDTNLDGFSDDFYYHLTDVQFSTVANVIETGEEAVIQRISYDPYGLARHHQFGDLNGDGATNSTDLMILLGNWGAFGPGDLNRDGNINVTDMLLLNANNAPALPFGQLSDSVTDNIVGFDGYLMSAYDTAYLARNRFYEPDRGRWLNRDPAGYVDGMSMYEYGMSSPFVFTDPYGEESYWSNFRSGFYGLFRGNADLNRWRQSQERNRTIMAAHDIRQLGSGLIGINEVQRRMRVQNSIVRARINADINVTQTRVDLVLGVGSVLSGGAAGVAGKGSSNMFRTAMGIYLGAELANAGVDFYQGDCPDGAFRAGGAFLGPLFGKFTKWAAPRAKELFGPWWDDVARRLGRFGGSKAKDFKTHSRSGSALDPKDKGGQLTYAGRALAKHGSQEGKRAGSNLFPSVSGNPAAINRQGQEILDSILRHPNRTVRMYRHPNYGNIMDIRDPSGRGVRYTSSGQFMGFID